MIKLPRNVKPQALIKVLVRLGFRKRAGKGSHVRMVHPDRRWTQIAVHLKPIPQGTLKAILKQARVSAEELLKNL